MRSPTPEAWLGVEPRHLATFVAVAETGSFRGAAGRLGYVQSAVSQHILQLERVLSVRLIDRSRGNQTLALTPQGRHLLGHASRMVDQMRAARADVEFLAGKHPLRIAAEPAAAALLPGLARRLAPMTPDEGLVLVEVAGSAQIQLVLDGEVDFAVGSFTDLPANVAQEQLHADHWAVVARSDEELAPAEPLKSLAVVRDRCLIEDRLHPLPGGSGRVAASRVIRCDRTATALELVRAGAGIAVLPQLAVGDTAPDLELLPAGDLLPPRVVSLIWQRTRRLPGIGSQTVPRASRSRWDDARTAA
jgi:DNA-binding transcriptional LysR family regulator